MGINRVEPKGKSKGERVFLVTADGEPGVVFWNEEKDLARCDTCHEKNCPHLDLLDAYLSIELYSIDWKGIIVHVLNNWTRTSWRNLWALVSDGKLFPGHPLRKKIRDYHRQVIMLLYYEHGLGYTPGGSKAIMERWGTDPELKPYHDEFNRLKAEWEESVVNSINFHIDHMTIPEIAYLKMTIVPWEMREIDWELLDPSWHNADEWADENLIYARAYDEGVIDFTL